KFQSSRFNVFASILPARHPPPLPLTHSLIRSSAQTEGLTQRSRGLSPRHPRNAPHVGCIHPAGWQTGPYLSFKVFCSNSILAHSLAGSRVQSSTVQRPRFWPLDFRNLGLGLWTLDHPRLRHPGSWAGSFSHLWSPCICRVPMSGPSALSLQPLRRDPFVAHQKNVYTERSMDYGLPDVHSPKSSVPNPRHIKG